VLLLFKFKILFNPTYSLLKEDKHQIKLKCFVNNVSVQKFIHMKNIEDSNLVSSFKQGTLNMVLKAVDYTISLEYYTIILLSDV